MKIVVSNLKSIKIDKLTLRQMYISEANDLKLGKSNHLILKGNKNKK